MAKQSARSGGPRSSLGLTVNCAQSVLRLFQPQGAIATSISDTCHYLSADLHGDACDRLVESLAQGHFSLQKYLLNVYFDSNWIDFADDCCVAVMLTTDRWVRVSPANTFQPACPFPCYGLVPPIVTLQVLEEPRGSVVALKHDFIYSAAFADYLQANSPCTVGRVEVAGKPSGYRRLFPVLEESVLATHLMDWRTCAACQSPLLAGRGALFGNRLDNFSICRNRDGSGHLGANHPMLLSLEMARRLLRAFPIGYSFEPIIDLTSPLGLRSQALIQLLNRFMPVSDT